MSDTKHTLAKEFLKATALPELEKSKAVADINKRAGYLHISPNEIGVYVMTNEAQLRAELEKACK